MVRNKEHDNEQSPLDLAARAAWLSFVGGLTQDQIAGELGISRQRAQRLVARAATEGLIHVRIDHKIADCLELERALKQRYDVASVWVSPGVGHNADPLGGLAPYAATVIETLLAAPEPKTFALGTGRTLRMLVKALPAIQGSHHKLVSLVGNVAPDGSATMYEAILRLAEKMSAKHYPMAIPVLARSHEEREVYHALPHVEATRRLAQSADIAIVGIGQMSKSAPLLVDGFITAQEQHELAEANATGEICGHVFDQNGTYIDHPINQRIVGTRVPFGDLPVYCIGAGQSKAAAIRSALKGGLLAGLVTDEYTAQSLLND